MIDEIADRTMMYDINTMIQSSQLGEGNQTPISCWLLPVAKTDFLNRLENILTFSIPLVINNNGEIALID